MLKSASQGTDTRPQRIFVAARHELDQHIARIVSSRAAAGRLKSGPTVRKVVSAASEITFNAVHKTLTGIGNSAAHPGSKQTAMLKELTTALSVHYIQTKEQMTEALFKIGLGDNVPHATILFDSECARHKELISEFKEGWTAPPRRPWNERHPILFVVAGALIAIFLGWIIKSFVGDQWQDLYKSAPAMVETPPGQDL